MRVLVCGGRDFTDADTMREVLEPRHAEQPFTLLIEGGARGADRIARLWAQARGIHVATVDALWDFYATSAGPRRNAVMLELKPDLVIAFPGGRGTANMIRLARSAKIRVVEITRRIGK